MWGRISLTICWRDPNNILSQLYNHWGFTNFINLQLTGYLHGHLQPYSSPHPNILPAVQRCHTHFLAHAVEGLGSFPHIRHLEEAVTRGVSKGEPLLGGDVWGGKDFVVWVLQRSVF
jgi:hypothetical protein